MIMYLFCLTTENPLSSYAKAVPNIRQGTSERAQKRAANKDKTALSKLPVMDPDVFKGTVQGNVVSVSINNKEDYEVCLCVCV